MNNDPPKIQTYVLKQLQTGLSMQDITEQLRAAGWAEADIQVAFTAAQAQLTPTPALANTQPPINGQQPVTALPPLGAPVQSRGRMKTGWLLFKQSLSVISSNPGLARYMAMSMIFSLVIMGGMVGVVLYDSSHSKLFFYEEVDYRGDTELYPTVLGGVLLAAVTFMTTFITFYYATALSSNVLGIFRGTPGTYAEHTEVARRKIPAIAVYALITVVVGFLLRLLEERFKLIGKIVSRILGTAWELANSFTIPIIADTDQSGPGAVKQSASLFKANWGETITGRVVLGGLLFLVYFAVGVPITIVLMFALGTAFGAMGVIAALALLIIGVIIIAMLEALATSVLNTSLYYYAQYKAVPPAFSPELLASVFTDKKRK